MELKSYSKKELLKNSSDELETEDFIKKIESLKIENQEEERKINSILNWKYKFSDFSRIQTKSSVTKIKQMQDLDFESKKDREEKFSQELIRPKFLSNEIKITNAQIGTLMHLCFKKMNVSINYTESSIKELVNSLYEAEIITKQELENINIKKLYEFTKSNLWNELKQAKKIYKEQPFYISIPVKDLYSNVAKTEDKILVQGIIDLYYINKDDKIVLVDYKTDFIKQGEEQKLIEKYKKQLEIYKKALENSLNEKVDKVIIYSVCLNKEISC